MTSKKKNLSPIRDQRTKKQANKGTFKNCEAREGTYTADMQVNI